MEAEMTVCRQWKVWRALPTDGRFQAVVKVSLIGDRSGPTQAELSQPQAELRACPTQAGFSQPQAKLSTGRSLTPSHRV